MCVACGGTVVVSLFLCAVGQDGGGGFVEDAVHRAALPLQVPRVSVGFRDGGVAGGCTYLER